METVDEREAVEAWAASGAMALTGRPERPLGPPAPLVDGVRALGERIEARSGELGTSVQLDWLALLGERAALAGLSRRGPVSCGGTTRLLRTADGSVAVALPRPTDVELVPAWLEVDVPSTGDVWAIVTAEVGSRPAAHLVERAALLGLAVGQLGERSWDDTGGVQSAPLGPAPPTRAVRDVVVLDLSALWAGPLCASLLGHVGATVIKVESTTRPDGARRLTDGFFDLLNAGKRSVAVDLSTRAGRAALAGMIRAADVVVEASRARALEQLGVSAADAVAGVGPRVWVSITGHGRSSARVAFGDDAAVAGGLVSSDADGPCFCADAVADPLTALAAAGATLDALVAGGRWLLDVAMAGVAATFAGPTVPAGAVHPAPARARPAVEQARPLGADNDSVLASL